MTAINHLQRTVDDILTQYKESSNLIGYIQAFQIQNQEIEDACNDLLTDRSLDTAVGTQLDVIGEIVGQSRIVEGFPNVLAWGYQTSAYTEGYNDGAYRDGSAQTIELDDDTYRLYIKARILRNHSQYTIDDILQAVAILVPTAESIVLTEGDMAFSLSVLDAAISVDQQNILKNGNIIPKPAGIKLDGIIFSDGPNLWQSADTLTTKVLSFLHTNVDAAWLLNDSAEWEKFDKIGSSSDPVDDPQVLKQYSPASPANVSELIGFELRDNVTGLNG
ncbi:MAG: DUF2612 domain-containing protein, partial [FCB group bacterium]|nr:DUF2612 domain-containing protein [FCB group bacterium]